MSKIHWINTANPKLKGEANDMEHFRKLNAMASGRLKVVKTEKQISKASQKVVKSATSN